MEFKLSRRDLIKTSDSSVPVFQGLCALAVTGREIAAALRVSPASVSKWRNGKSKVPDDVLVFLTLLLGDQIECGRDTKLGSSAATSGGRQTVLIMAESELRLQERLNARLPSMAIREGVRRYRLWWNGTRNSILLQPSLISHGFNGRHFTSLR
ncbi:MAG: hypothetical protein CBB68_07850 [Rhodospirillaceae bacterium TMED8]|nr:hypothetical protein [Magnetovibrio sp.]OUT50890.1 MAG: hypothetical protein CBB68_07850 [Rhodospirillaceae bacterium TMED8]|tara:strand:- start:3492 stop:3953 length:462 start_codon:yes stop_codon:yes gene_type:complete